MAPTRVRPVLLAAWSAAPNVQVFWLLDAVTQNRLIPASHVLLVALYGVNEIVIFLAVGVLLFQRREVG